MFYKLKIRTFQLRICSIFFFGCLFISHTADAESKAIINHTISVDWTDYKIETFCAADSDTFCSFTLSDYTKDKTVGCPEILIHEFGFLVPDGAGNFKISTDYHIKEFVSLEYPIFPVQQPWSLNDLDNRPFTSLSDSLRISGATYNIPSILDEYYINGKYHVVRVGVPIMGYNHSNREAELYDAVHVSLTYETDVQPCLALDGDASSILDDDIQDYVVNFPNQQLLSATSTSEWAPVFTPYYYIITSKELLTSVDKFAQWKRQKGFEVVVKTVEEILALPESQINHTTIRDEAEALRNWIISERKQIGKFNLLLVGDTKTSFPIRKFREYDNSSTYHDYSGENYIPTDGYFSDVTTDFSLSLDNTGHYSAKVSTLKYSPELPTGRLLTHSKTDIDNYLSKLLIYELLPDYSNTGYLNNTLVTRQYQHREYGALIDNISGFSKNIELTDTNGYTSFEINAPTGEMVISSMKNCGLISLQGHGGPITIACSGGNDYPGSKPTSLTAYGDFRRIRAQSYYPNLDFEKKESNNALDDLHNEKCPGIIYTLSCHVMPFDILNMNNITYDYPYNIGAAYTMAGKYGGVAFIGNTRTGYDGSTTQMESSFGTYINNDVPIGQAQINSTFAINSKYSQYTRNILGDPDIRIWRGQPAMPDYTIEESNTISGKLPKIIGNLSNCRLSVFDGKSTISSYQINNGYSFQLPFSISGDYLISIYKPNQVPYLKLIADGVTLNEPHSYILRNLSIGESTKYSYTIGKNGLLELKSLGDVSSDHGFNLKKGGELIINSDGPVSLKNDLFESGGNVNIKSSEVTLGAGFEIKPGGSLSIETF